MGDGRTLQELAEIPVPRVKQGGRQAGRGARRRRHHERPRPDHPLPAPLHRPDPPGRRGGDDAWVRSPWSSPASTSVQSRRTRQGRALVELDVDDGTGSVAGDVLQPGLAGQAAPGGHRGTVLREARHLPGKRQFTNPVVDLVGNRTGRIVPIYPTSEKTRHRRLGVRRVDRGGAAPGGDARRSRCPRRWRRRARPHGPDRRPSGAIHAPESFAEQRAGPPAAGLRRAPAAPARGGHAAARAIERDARGIATPCAPAPARRRPRGRLPRPPPVLPDRAQRPGHRRDHARTWPGRLPMHRLLQGDVGSGKTVVAVAALLVAVQGGHQGALMAPTEVLAEQHFLGVRELLADLVVPDPQRLGGQRPVGGGPAHQPDAGGGAGQAARGAARPGPSTSSSAPTRCSPTRCASPAWAWWSSTSSTDSASSSAPRCGPRAETQPAVRVRTPTCW